MKLNKNQHIKPYTPYLFTPKKTKTDSVKSALFSHLASIKRLNRYPVLLLRIPYRLFNTFCAVSGRRTAGIFYTRRTSRKKGVLFCIRPRTTRKGCSGGTSRL